MGVGDSMVPQAKSLESTLHMRMSCMQQVLNQLAASSTSQPLRSPITSHVLDTALGVPAQGLPLVLHKLNEHSKQWEVLGQGLTNKDGRAGNLLPPSNYLAPGRWGKDSLMLSRKHNAIKILLTDFISAC